MIVMKMIVYNLLMIVYMMKINAKFEFSRYYY